MSSHTVRASPRDCAVCGWLGRWRKRHARFESSEALAEQPAVARTAVELHGCCVGTSLAEALLRQHIDGVARASSVSNESGSRARSLVLLTILAPVSRTARLERVGGPARARRRSERENRRRLRHGQLSSPWRSGRRFPSFQRQRAPAGPPNSRFRNDTPRNPDSRSVTRA